MKISKNLSINTFGTAGAGKSTLAMIIADALKAAGIPCVVSDEDTLPEMLIAKQGDRTRALAQRLVDAGEVIEIKQVQLRRTV